MELSNESGGSLSRHADADSPSADSEVASRQLVSLTLFDGFRLHRGAFVRLPGAAQRLIAYLCVSGPTHRNVLCGQLWPESSEKNARASLRTTLWLVQQQARGCLETLGDVVQISRLADSDLCRFYSLARTLVEQPRAPLNLDESELLRVLSTGELLPGWYDEWLDDVREQIRQTRLHALEALSARQLELGRFAAALDAALAAVRVEPLRETAAAAVIAVHMAESNIVEAVRHYERFRAELWRELGVAPSNSLTALLPGPPLRIVAVPSRREVHRAHA